MRKFECNYCANPCVLTFNNNCNNVPRFCPYLTTQPTNWHEVKEDNAENEQFGNSEQLPDWVKVGGWIYNTKRHEYFKILHLNQLAWISDEIKNGDYIEARERPFNADEMKALVGKVIEDNQNNISLVTDYDFFTKKICIHGEYLNNNDLIDYDITVNGKLCYKLEHLKNGEWVE